MCHPPDAGSLCACEMLFGNKFFGKKKLPTVICHTASLVAGLMILLMNQRHDENENQKVKSEKITFTDKRINKETRMILSDKRILEEI